MYILLISLLSVFVTLLVLFLVLKMRHAQYWVPMYYMNKITRPKHNAQLKHVMFCFVDHYEPMWGKADKDTQSKRVDRWVGEYKALASKHRDSDGCHPKHTFFYPEEEYTEDHLNKIAGLCKDGFGEIEVHIHHNDDTEDNFNSTIRSFTKTLHEKHGALSKCPETGDLRWAFIHGNWCLDNSRIDGKWCGLNNEITLLKELGCYADYTLPSAPDSSQTSKINSIYYAKDDPARPKSHNTGKDVEVNGTEWGDLMIIQGPLCINWKRKGMLLIPKIENSDIRMEQRPFIERMKDWLDCNIHVKGRDDWLFVKIHTHGAQEDNMGFLLGEQMDQFFTDLESQYNNDEYCLHYVSAREVYNIIKAAEAGNSGNPNQYRDYELSAPLWGNN